MRLFYSIIFLLFFILSSAAQSSWQSRGIGGGGSLYYPTINPANDNEFYITCDMGQLFHSTDFGLTYTEVPFTRLQTSHISTYEYTNNKNIAYCIANNDGFNYAVRTMDGGNSWNPLPGNPLNGEAVFSLKADYAVPGRIIINYYRSIYISNDYGANFSLVWNTANNNAGLMIAGVFFDGNEIYIATNEGILYSSNGGSSFTKLITSGIPATQTIFSFAGAKSGSVKRFFCITASPEDVYNRVPPWEFNSLAKGVYSMDAGTNTWVEKMNGINVNTDFVMYVGMAQNDINTVYLGGNDAVTKGNCVIKTTNAGNSWNKVFLTANNQNIRTGWAGHKGDREWSYGESCFGITVAPNNANKVLFGDYGFVHKTSNGGVTWQQAYIHPGNEHKEGLSTPKAQSYQSIGLENTSVWQTHWQDANKMFACFSDIRGLRSKDGGSSWCFDYAGHTANTMYRIAKHISNNTMFAATSGIHDLYQSTRLKDNPLDNNDPGGRIIYSHDDGATWQLLHQFNHPVFWLATDPNNANRMYASVTHYGNGSGTGGIWVTNNLNNLSNSTWTKLSNPPRTQGHPATIVVLNDGKVVCTFSGRRDANGFTPSSGIFIYDPLKNSWSDVSHPDMHYWTKDVVLAPADPSQNTWYVGVFSGWGGAAANKGGLFKTTNRGASWTKLTGNQFNRVTSIAFNPLASNQAYLTTETQGLWISDNMNDATPTWSLVSSYSFRQPERVFFNPYNPKEVWVTSFGNGLKVGENLVTKSVKLIFFAGNRQDDGKIFLQWEVTDVEKGDKFEIERSNNGIDFVTIDEIIAQGDKNIFSYIDTNTESDLHYRIKITSVGGTVIYSNIVIIKSKIFNDVQLLNNPIQQQINLLATLQDADELQLTLINAAGQNCVEQKLAVNAGTSNLHVRLPFYCASGIYILKIKGKHVNKSIPLAIFH